MKNEYELYFYFEGDHESEDAIISSMCCDCHNRDWGYLGFYYKGPLTKWKYVCRKCGNTIKDGITDDQPNNNVS